MKSPRLVCPDSESVFQTLHGHEIAVRVQDPASIPAAVGRVDRSGNRLLCVILDYAGPLSDLVLDEPGLGHPLAIMARSAGRFRDLAPKIAAWRRGNLRIFLPADNPANLTALRILSSLNLSCAADFLGGTDHWDEILDLASYAILGREPHAPIQPFAAIAEDFVPGCNLEWGRQIFDDPAVFLHLDEEGRVALSRADLKAGRFAAHNLGEIDSADDFPPIRDRLEERYRRLIEGNPCTFCAGWRFCFARFEAIAAEGACAAFCGELIELARQYQANRKVAEGRAVWQP